MSEVHVIIGHMNDTVLAEAASVVDVVTRRVCGLSGAAGQGRGPGGASELLGSVAQCATVIDEAQAMINQLTAVQAVAIAQIAATESVYAEDGTVEERRRVMGHVRIDAAALVAEPLGVTQTAAQRRVSLAVREVTVLRALHESMAAGALDGWRAAVVAEELLDAPDYLAGRVAERVVDGLVGRSGADVRRRVRRALAAVDEEWLRRRTERARRDRSVRRWAHEPGVDAWFGTFPAERSALAWAAVDDLAQRYRRAGCETLEQARADAMLDLVLGRATSRVTVQLTVPAAHVAAEVGSMGGSREAAPAEVAAEALQRLCSDEGFIEVRGLDGAGTSEVPAVWVGEQLAKALEKCADVARRPAPGADAAQAPGVRGHVARPGPDGAKRTLRVVACHSATGSLVDRDGVLSSAGYRPGADLVRFVCSRDGHCRFPGCTVGGRFCDFDHVRPWPTGPTSADNLVLLCRRHHRVKQSPGWQASFREDGSMRWRTPHGRILTSEPLDHRSAQSSPGTAGSTGVPHGTLALTADHEGSAGSRRRVLDPGPFSRLEHSLEHVIAVADLEHSVGGRAERGLADIDMRRCVGSIRASIRWASCHSPRPKRRGHHRTGADPPPF